MSNFKEINDTRQLFWLRPETVPGDKTAISSDCGRFCITKKDGEYQPMSRTGATWTRLKPCIDIDSAKECCEALA